MIYPSPFHLELVFHLYILTETLGWCRSFSVVIGSLYLVTNKQVIIKGTRGYQSSVIRCLKGILQHKQ